MINEMLRTRLAAAMDRLDDVASSALVTNGQLEELDSALLALEGIRQEIRESFNG